MNDGYRVGVDIGGTFTDVVVVSEHTGKVQYLKVPSTPFDLSVGFLAGVERAMETDGLVNGSIRHLVHGTTVATNTIIERKHAKTAFVVTRGFRDLLEIARQTRPDLYDLFQDRPEPLVPRELCFEVDERIDATGAVLTPLDVDGLGEIVAALRSGEVESVAICFLHSYRFPDHERRVAALLRNNCSGMYVSASSDVLPVFREYLRASTTVVNAAVQPVVHRYLDRISVGLKERNIHASVHIMQSNGGLCSRDFAADLPVYIVESGPAAGVIAAARIATVSGFPDIISFDMGGTTAKAALIESGQPKFANEFEVGTRASSGRGAGRGHGYPIQTPMLDLVEVGAGGGSIAWIDGGGILHVGPVSSGALPGPACYGQGGDEPTVTDANLVLGRLNPDNFLGGAITLDVDAAWRAIEARCARPIGLSVVEAAAGIVAVANANMVGALRLVSVQRGYDPREFALLAFGGAGPLHANALAIELAIPATIIPPTAGVASAFGLLLADLVHTCSQTYAQNVQDLDVEVLGRMFLEFQAEATATLLNEGVDHDDMRFRREMDLRYVGQAYELRITIPNGTLDSTTIRQIEQSFHSEHRRNYAYAAPGEPVELVNVRLVATGTVSKPRFVEVQPGTQDPVSAMTSSRQVHFARSGFLSSPVYQRNQLAYQNKIDGPAIVEQFDSTTVIHPGWQASVDRFGNLLIRPNQLRKD